MGGPTDRSERYSYDDRNRLTQVDRGVLSANGTKINTPWVGPLASKQQWVDLDHRGNWLDFRQTYGGEMAYGPGYIETRQADGVNSVQKIDPDGPQEASCDPPGCYVGMPSECGPGCVETQSLWHDLAGNVTFNPFAPIAGENCGAAALACASGQEYDYDEENRVVAIYKDTNDATGPFNETTGANEELKIYEFKYDALACLDAWHGVLGALGLEPRTHGLKGRCSAD